MKPTCNVPNDCAFPQCRCGESKLLKLQDEFNRGIEKYFALLDQWTGATLSKRPAIHYKMMDQGRYNQTVDRVISTMKKQK